MKKNFLLSFGISLLIVAILSIFFETNRIILFGISISALIMTITNFLSNAYEFKYAQVFYAIALVIMIACMAFSESLMKIDVMNQIVNSRITDIITFFSYGLIFTFEYYNSQIEIAKDNNHEIKRTINQFETINAIYRIMINDMEERKKRGGKIDFEIENKITKYLDSLSLLTQVKSNLLQIDDYRNEYNIKEIEEVFQKECEDLHIESSDQVTNKSKKENAKRA